MEVDQKTNWNMEQPEVGQKLSLVDGAKNILALQFDHDFAFDDNVSTKATVHLYAFINDRNKLLPFHSKTGFLEFLGEAGFVTGFQQPRAKLPVDLDCYRNDLLC
jgi:hypothetical protein